MLFESFHRHCVLGSFSLRIIEFWTTSRLRPCLFGCVIITAHLFSPLSPRCPHPSQFLAPAYTSTSSLLPILTRPSISLLEPLSEPVRTLGIDNKVGTDTRGIDDADAICISGPLRVHTEVDRVVLAALASKYVCVSFIWSC